MILLCNSFVTVEQTGLQGEKKIIQGSTGSKLATLE